MNEEKNHQLEDLNGDYDHLKDYWTEHRITLIAFETQYVYQRKPSTANSKEEQVMPGQKNHKPKRKDVEYEGAFLFPGRSGEKEKEIKVIQEIQKSEYSNLKQLFFEEKKTNEDSIALRDFVKIMLQLKHQSVFSEFMDIYDLILKEIKDIKFESISAEQPRMTTIQKIAEKVARHIQSNHGNFKLMNGYLKDGKKQTLKLFKVTIYCFLAEKHNFNINQFYAEAFEVMEEKKVPKKKRKTE